MLTTVPICHTHAGLKWKSMSKNSKCVCPFAIEAAVLTKAQAQLGRFRDHADGSISGKGEDKHDDDDVAMATLLVVDWAFEILAYETLG